MAALPECWRVARLSRGRGLPRPGPECGCLWHRSDQGAAQVLSSNECCIVEKIKVTNVCFVSRFIGGRAVMISHDKQC